MRHLCWYKKRQTILRSKIERLPDDHHCKPYCLFWLSRLFESIGNHAERKSILLRLLSLDRSKGDDYEVARTLRELSYANRMLGLLEEGIREAKEALEIMERVGDAANRAMCLETLGDLLCEDNQLDAAEEAIIGAMNLWEEDQELGICRSHHNLGLIYSSRGERDKALYHFEVALGIASRFEWHYNIFWIHYSMARLFYKEDELDDAQTHITQAKLHAADDKFFLGRAMVMEAWIWFKQDRLEDATSAALCAKEIYEKLGAARGLGKVTDLLREIEEAMESRATPTTSNSSA
ncbi:hypothetical protein BJ322DRAFT_1077603 [Thelephora terrestris]|uniref:Uncharacterized protein n=1 Tax=Thelephora terrestris TaxID=56493 RepID=A0A9P6L4D7_9AGAM|nr:hypothetical protein BJ322DRAFT_1077603 [Thelephora terrestris]